MYEARSLKEFQFFRPNLSELRFDPPTGSLGGLAPRFPWPSRLSLRRGWEFLAASCGGSRRELRIGSARSRSDVIHPPCMFGKAGELLTKHGSPSSHAALQRHSLQWSGGRLRVTCRLIWRAGSCTTLRGLPRPSSRKMAPKPCRRPNAHAKFGRSEESPRSPACLTA